MKRKELLIDAYIMGLETLGEAYGHVFRNAHLYFSDADMDMELDNLTKSIRNYADNTKITDMLTEQEMREIDKELEEDLK